jgi:hypothetical protein
MDVLYVYFAYNILNIVNRWYIEDIYGHFLGFIKLGNWSIWIWFLVCFILSFCIIFIRIINLSNNYYWIHICTLDMLCLFRLLICVQPILSGILNENYFRIWFCNNLSIVIMWLITGKLGRLNHYLFSSSLHLIMVFYNIFHFVFLRVNPMGALKGCLMMLKNLDGLDFCWILLRIFQRANQ